MFYGQTIIAIVGAVNADALPPVFTPKQVNVVLGIDFAGTFLPKHRVGNPGGMTPLFIQINRGQYKLNRPYITKIGL